MKKGLIKATGPFERVVHWCVALSCLFLCLTGMAMMYHSLNVVGTLVGGMENLKILHNYGGIFFGVSLVVTILMWWKEAGLFPFQRICSGLWQPAAIFGRWRTCRKSENIIPVRKCSFWR